MLSKSPAEMANYTILSPAMYANDFALMISMRCKEGINTYSKRVSKYADDELHRKSYAHSCCLCLWSGLMIV